MKRLIRAYGAYPNWNAGIAAIPKRFNMVKKMKETILILLAALLVSIFIKIFLFKKRKARDNVTYYICDHCGDHDCICHNVDNKSDS